MKTLVGFFMGFFLIVTACSHLQEIKKPDSTSRGGESYRFLEIDSITFSSDADSVIVRSKGDFIFNISHLRAIQGKDTFNYNKGDLGLFDMENYTCLQSIIGPWFTVQTLPSDNLESPVYDSESPAMIKISVLPNTSEGERKIKMEVLQGDARNYLYIIQPEK